VKGNRGEGCKSLGKGEGPAKTSQGFRGGFWCKLEKGGTLHNNKKFTPGPKGGLLNGKGKRTSTCRLPMYERKKKGSAFRKGRNNVPQVAVRGCERVPQDHEKKLEKMKRGD